MCCSLYASQACLVRGRKADGCSRGNQVLDWESAGKSIVRTLGKLQKNNHQSNVAVD